MDSTEQPPNLKTNVVADDSICPAKPLLKSRRGKAKTRTGCITCKIRRVKCDEAKPNCLKCTSTGRKCDGYLQLPPRSGVSGIVARAQRAASDASMLDGGTRPGSTVLPIIRNSFLDFRGSSLEQRHLNFFHTYTSPVLAGYFDADFWNSLLPRVGHSQPTIQHAMMAVASIHEQVEAESAALFSQFRKDYTTAQIRPFALQQYNMAICALKQKISSDSKAQEVTLMCCILFICLEFLRGDISTAIDHLHNGVEILISWRKQLSRSRNASLSESPTDAEAIESNLSMIFSRLTVQSMLCGHPENFINSNILDPKHHQLAPIIFTSLLQARTSMDHLIKVSLRFLRVAAVYKYQPQCPEREAVDMQRRAYLTRLEQWSRAFVSFLSVSPFRVTSQNQKASAILQIQNKVAKIWLGTCLEPYNMIQDQYLESFTDIIALASSLNHDYSDNSRQSYGSDSVKPRQFWGATVSGSFAFEMGVIPCLYFVATQCRDRLIRRGALSLLATTIPRREGLWDANLVGAVAERVIEIEEEGLDDWTASPFAENRVHDAIIHDEVNGSNSQKVSFFLRPSVPNGSWEVRCEEVSWVDGSRVWVPREPPVREEWTMMRDRIEVFHVDKGYRPAEMTGHIGTGP